VRQVIEVKNPALHSATLFLLLVVASAALGQEPARPQATPEPLRVIVYDGQLRALLATFAEQYHVVIGFESDAQSPERIKFEARDVTFHQTLDAMVIAEPRYQWREIDGSIEFYPTVRINPVLDTVIQNFEVKDSRFAEAVDSLINLPEVKSSLAAMALTRNESGNRPRGVGNAFSLRVEQVTVRQALHQIAKRSGTYFWSFHVFGDKQKFFSVGTTL